MRQRTAEFVAQTTNTVSPLFFPVYYREMLADGSWESAPICHCQSPKKAEAMAKFLNEAMNEDVVAHVRGELRDAVMKVVNA